MAKKLKTTVGPRWAGFCGWLLRKMGWESVGGPMTEPKAIVLGVPHTTVWDFLVSYLFYTQFGKVAHIMVKKSFFFWPLGPILKACGAVPTDLSSPATTVKSLIEVMEAKETGATVYLGYYDWGRKRISVGERFELTDDPKADMLRIYDHYRPMGIQGFHKDQFAVPDAPKSE